MCTIDPACHGMIIEVISIMRTPTSPGGIPPTDMYETSYKQCNNDQSPHYTFTSTKLGQWPHHQTQHWWQNWLTCHKHIEAETKWPTFRRRHFQAYFIQWKCLNFDEKKSIKFVSKGPIYKNAALFQIMAWCHPGDKPLSEAMLVSSLTHKCVTRPQWVKYFLPRNAILTIFY